MKRLLILDPSLKGPGGHHFDYVGQLLRAAQEQYQVVVACHQKFDARSLEKMARAVDVPKTELDFRPVFRETIYHTCSDIAGIRKLAQAAQRGLRRWTVPIKRRWDQWIGEGRRELAVLDEPPCDDSRQRQVLESLDRSQLRVLAGAVQDLRQVFRANVDSSDRFDAIFHTTLSELDLLALAWSLKEGTAPRESLWSLQCHFDLFLGRPDEHRVQRSSARTLRCRETFRLAHAWMKGCPVQWFATSHAIARQHNWLGVGKFQELTYPISPNFVPLDRPVDERPLRITLAGGVRSEKGQSRLEHVVSSIVDPLLQTRRAVIVVQRRARKGWRKPFELPPHLCGPNREWIEYVDHPLPDSAYVGLMRNADVGLMLHDGRTYHARRAGVLGEFLAAGVPVVVPAASWLAHCVDSLNGPYWEGLANDSATIAIANGKAIGSDEILTELPLVPGGLLVGTVVTSPGIKQNAYLRLRLCDHQGTLIAQAMVGGGASPLRFALPMPTEVQGSQPARLHWQWNFHEQDMLLPTPNFTLHLVPPKQGVAIPWGAVGCVAVDDLHVAQCLQELHQHHQHYRHETRHASHAWRIAHDPKRTLATLFERPTSARWAA